MSIIAFITDLVPVRSILSYLDLPTRSPPLSPARAPPQGIFEFDQTGGFDPADPEPIPEFEFDVTLILGGVLTTVLAFRAIGGWRAFLEVSGDKLRSCP